MKTWLAGAKSPDRLRMLISRIQAKQLVWNALSGTGLNSLLLSWAFPINRGEHAYRGDRFGTRWTNSRICKCAPRAGQPPCMIYFMSPPRYHGAGQHGVRSVEERFLERWANEADDVLPTRLGRLRCVVGWVSSFQEFGSIIRILHVLLHHHNISRTSFVMADWLALVLRPGLSSANVKTISTTEFANSCQRAFCTRWLS